MTTYAIGGQSSGDFRETSSRVQLFHVVTRNSLGLLAPTGFTQANPPVVATNISTTLAGITKAGVLGGSVAFTRGDFGNNYIPRVYSADCKLLGFLRRYACFAYTRVSGRTQISDIHDWDPDTRKFFGEEITAEWSVNKATSPCPRQRLQFDAG